MATAPPPLYTHPAIHGFNVPPGVYLSPSAHHDVLLKLNRKKTPKPSLHARTPSRLARRTLYIPPHDANASHLPLYELTAGYRRALRDEPLGTPRFRSTLGRTRKPGAGAGDVSYLVDFDGPREPGRRRTTDKTCATVRSRTPRGSSSSQPEVHLVIPAHGAGMNDGGGERDGAVACTVTPAWTGAPLELVTSTGTGTRNHPWFTFAAPGGRRALQWQVHAGGDGALRYTLVEIPLPAVEGEDESEDESEDDDEDRWWEDEKTPIYSSVVDEKKNTTTGKTRSTRQNDNPPFSATDTNNQHLIRAIYHGIGRGSSSSSPLSQPFGEGALLLLQDDLGAELQAVIVASLLGLLWRARGEECKPGKMNQKSEVDIALPRKKSVSMVTVVEKEYASSTHSSPRSSSPVKNGLFRRILRGLAI